MVSTEETPLWEAVSEESPPEEIADAYHAFMRAAEHRRVKGYLAIQIRGKLIHLLGGLPRSTELRGGKPEKLIADCDWFFENLQREWEGFVKLVKAAHEKEDDPDRFSRKPTEIGKLEPDLRKGDLIVNPYNVVRLFTGLTSRTVFDMVRFVFPELHIDGWNNIYPSEEGGEFPTFDAPVEGYSPGMIAYTNSIAFIAGRDADGHYVEVPTEEELWKTLFGILEQEAGITFDWKKRFQRLELAQAFSHPLSQIRKVQWPTVDGRKDPKYCVVLDTRSNVLDLQVD